MNTLQLIAGILAALGWGAFCGFKLMDSWGLVLSLGATIVGGGLIGWAIIAPALIALFNSWTLPIY